jgi:hypothetical protein
MAPPSSTMVVPVIYDASSQAKKTAALPTSADRPSRRKGVRAISRAVLSASSDACPPSRSVTMTLMGQYHHPVCIEAEEGLSPHALGCGLKEGEQGFTRPGTPNAIVALVCARGGNMPADCFQSPLIGRWAGKRVLVQGDYAEDGDIPNWDGPPLSTLYRAMRPLDEREPWDGMPEGYWDVPVFTDISAEACGFLEAACNVRFFEQKHQVQDQKGKRSHPS